MQEFKTGHRQTYFNPDNKYTTTDRHVAMQLAWEKLVYHWLVNVEFNNQTGEYTIYWGA